MALKSSGRTFEDCLKDALKYSSRNEWAKNSKKFYEKARVSDWLDKCCSHMLYVSEPNKWTLEACKADALKYKSKKEWEKNSPKSYRAALRKKWLKECSGHMVPFNRVNWTLEMCKADALKYNRPGEWKKNSHNAHRYASKKGWLKECCAHMSRAHKNWNLNKCKKDALKFNSRYEWQIKNQSGYSAAQRNGWLDECCWHMEILNETKWTLEACKIDALKYKSKKEWREASSSAYIIASRNGWIHKCCGHMKTLGGTSIPEQELKKCLDDLLPSMKILSNKRFGLSFKQKKRLNLIHIYRYELDIYIPDLNLGIEFNGTYWHSFNGLKRSRQKWTDDQIKNYHKDKKRYFKSIGIKVINVKQKDWTENKKHVIDNIKEILYGKQMDKSA